MLRLVAKAADASLGSGLERSDGPKLAALGCGLSSHVVLKRLIGDSLDKAIAKYGPGRAEFMLV